MSDAYLTARNRIQRWYGAMHSGGHRQFAADLEGFETAVRAEAIRERDEAITLLRERHDLDVESRDAMARSRWTETDMAAYLGAAEDNHERTAAFLSRFPEGGEG